MRTGGKIVKRLVRLITGADTDMVSLVGHGANQQPFAFVKSEDMQELENVHIDDKETNISRPVPNHKFAIQKITYNKTNYDTDKIKKHLLQLGIDQGSYVLEDELGDYIAKSKNYDKINTETVSLIKGNQAGVNVYVGELLDESQQEIEKSIKLESPQELEAKMNILKINGSNTKEIVEKFNYWSAYYSSGKTMAEVLSSGMEDGMPPGSDEINAAFWTVVANAVQDKDYGMIQAAAKELGDLVVDIMSVFDKVTETMEKNEMSDELKKALIQKLQGSEVEATEEKVEGDDKKEPETKPEVEKSDEEGESKVSEPVAEPTAPKVEEEVKQPAEETKTEAEVVTEPAPVELEKATKETSELASVLADVIKEQLAPLKEDITKMSSRVQVLEGTTTTRKGSESNEEESKTPEKAKTEEDSTRVFKSDSKLTPFIGL